ncbi:MAG: insulinase family protein [bacterium]|nr:insulinase family protein [bacterium]
MPIDSPRYTIDRWLGPLRGIERYRLDNGLEVRLVPSSQAPIVVASLWYRVGARDEPPEYSGIAHFLEHMMFKGSDRFPMGSIDRLTQSLGGDNNAFTSHDVTSYYFSFASEHWQTALEIEADRMEHLTLDEREIEREREVILEEISMYEDDPWDALELRTRETYYRGYPYGRPILGRRETVRAIDRNALESFYRANYGPDNAVLVLAGDLGGGALAEVETRLGKPRPIGIDRRAPRGSFAIPDELRRVRHDKGRSPRLLVALPAPRADHDDFAPWRLWMTVLGGGRSSRLHRRLVDEGKLCSAMSAELTEAAGPGVAMISAELLPGVEPARVEDLVLDGLRELLRHPQSPVELENAKRMLLADWVFGLERILRQGLAVGQAEAVFDAGYPERHLRGLLGCESEDLETVARRNLTTAGGDLGGVVGWARAGAD